MIQGTTSDAGKSTLVVGLCRILKRRGISVAPFKPQNMALNSAVTNDGGEIGRAQALQAQACGIEPHTGMNPVLLKPNSDTGAQVIIHGHALSNMDAQQYHLYKTKARTAVLASHKRLCKQYQCIVVEGAGSPAEINLRDNDIANMGFAEAVDCPVVLVADIDRGGVFAHLVGTLGLLSNTEQARIEGFIINCFRGDLALLETGLDWLEKKTGKPVLGVVPYLHDLYLDAEDALPKYSTQSLSTVKKKISIVVPVFPHISNHTDFDSLRQHPEVDLQFVSIQKPLPACDVVILPGTKSVRRDLALLQQTNWPQNIKRHLRYGGKVLGICGGFQMLGEKISDPNAVESAAGMSQGLGLLNMTTELKKNKKLQQVSGKFYCYNNDHGISVKGYEIHCGVSYGEALQRPLLQLTHQTQLQNDGAISEDGQIIGTYVHGIFDVPEALQHLLRWAGLAKPQVVDLNKIRETQIDRLADTLEKSLDQHWLNNLSASQPPIYKT